MTITISICFTCFIHPVFCYASKQNKNFSCFINALNLKISTWYKLGCILALHKQSAYGSNSSNLWVFITQPISLAITSQALDSLIQLILEQIYKWIKFSSQSCQDLTTFLCEIKQEFPKSKPDLHVLGKNKTDSRMEVSSLSTTFCDKCLNNLFNWTAPYLDILSKNYESSQRQMKIIFIRVNST